jgi:hypothetical protein
LVCGVFAAARRTGEDAGAAGAIDCPDGVDARTDPGPRALQAGFVQEEHALVGVHGADDAVDPL